MTVARDAAVKGGGNGVNSFTLDPLTTTSANELILVGIHMTGDATAIQSVTSPGLTFVRVLGPVNVAAGQGNFEVWRALAASTLTNAVITVTFVGTPNPQTSAAAMTLSGVDTSGVNGAGAIGATSIGANGSVTNPSRQVVTTRVNSLVVGFLGLTGNPSITAGAAQTREVVGSSSPGTFSEATSSRQNATTAGVGTAVTINYTLGAAVPGAMAVLEILPPGTVAGTPPVNTVAPVVTGTSQLGSTLNVTNGNWTGTAPITFTYQWQQADDENFVLNVRDIAGATNNSYVVQGADAGKFLRARVFAHNPVNP